MTTLARFALLALTLAFVDCGSNKSETCTTDAGVIVNVGDAAYFASCNSIGCSAYACVAPGVLSCVLCEPDAGHDVASDGVVDSNEAIDSQDAMDTQDTMDAGDSDTD